MMTHVMINRYPVDTMATDADTVRKGLLGVGIALCVLGALALLLPAAAGIAVELVIGAVFLVAGTLGLIQALSGGGRRWRGALIGLIAALVGLFLVLQPIGGALVLATVLAVYFLVDGVFGITTAVYARDTAAAGMIGIAAAFSVLLGIVMLVLLPQAAPWLLGLVVGIHLLGDGIVSLIMSNRIRHATPA
ncbi:MAG: HdeD family acid-resistance protein [Planctomycetota bacterium]